MWVACMVSLSFNQRVHVRGVQANSAAGPPTHPPTHRGQQARLLGHSRARRAHCAARHTGTYDGAGGQAGTCVAAAVLPALLPFGLRPAATIQPAGQRPTAHPARCKSCTVPRSAARLQSGATGRGARAQGPGSVHAMHARAGGAGAVADARGPFACVGARGPAHPARTRDGRVGAAQAPDHRPRHAHQERHLRSNRAAEAKDLPRGVAPHARMPVAPARQPRRRPRRQPPPACPPIPSSP